MTGAMFEMLRKKYGVRIAYDGVEWRNSKLPTTLYKIYTADGCQWENGLTYKGVLMECKKWAKSLLQIKENWSESTLPFC